MILVARLLVSFLLREDTDSHKSKDCACLDARRRKMKEERRERKEFMLTCDCVTLVPLALENGHKKSRIKFE